MNKIYLTFLSFFLIWTTSFSQDFNEMQDSVEVTVVDSYITPELPHYFMLSFFTSSPAKSKVLVANKYEYNVSDSLSESHSIKIDLTKLNFKNKSIPYIITVQDSSGKS